MIPEDCQLQDLFLCLHAISKFSVIVRGCLDCFSQTLNLHIFMCWYSSATYLLTCSAGLKHKFLTPSLPSSHSLWTEWLSQWLLLYQSSFSWPFGKLFEFWPCVSQKLWSSFTIPQRISISAFDSFALENTPGLRLKIMTLEKLAVRGQA